MSRDPDARYAGAMELAGDLEAYLEHRPVTARRHTLRELARLAVARNPRVAVTVATAAAVLLIATLTFVLNLKESHAETSKALGDLEVESAERLHLFGILSTRALLEQADDFQPVLDDVRAAESWLERVDQLLPRRGAYEARLADLDAGHPDAAELESTLAGMGSLAALRPKIAAWRDAAESLRARTVDAEQEAWARAREEVLADERYGGLALEPQVGLVPLGADPLSGLQEFLHVPSGAAPERDPDDGRYLVEDETGIVLVLLPGGTFLMGDDKQRGATPDHQARIEVAPFFLAKFETTQAQWMRCMESPASNFRAGNTLPDLYAYEHLPFPLIPTNPVESISWFEAKAFTERYGLRLPHEDEWEYACRAGTTTYFPYGNDEASLQGKENLRDEAATILIGTNAGGLAAWNDEFAVHAPVGTFAPNGFGLFDVCGNVSEWVEDWYEGDWIGGDDPVRKIWRGGSWYHPTFTANSSLRFYKNARFNEDWLGVRVARSLE